LQREPLDIDIPAAARLFQGPLNISLEYSEFDRPAGKHEGKNRYASHRQKQDTTQQFERDDGRCLSDQECLPLLRFCPNKTSSLMKQKWDGKSYDCSD